MIEQSCVDGRDLVYRFDNRDPRDWGLNMFLALSQARLEDLGIAPTRANVIMFAGYLAIPDIVGTAEAFEKQTHLPFWYIAAYCHARASGTESGVMRLVVS
jgi:hypothetical protein